MAARILRVWLLGALVSFAGCGNGDTAVAARAQIAWITALPDGTEVQNQPNEDVMVDVPPDAVASPTEIRVFLGLS